MARLHPGEVGGWEKREGRRERRRERGKGGRTEGKEEGKEDRREERPIAYVFQRALFQRNLSSI